MRSGKEIASMVGAREGVPTGLFRYTDYVIDSAPGIVVSTEFALSPALIAIATVIHEELAAEASGTPLQLGASSYSVDVACWRPSRSAFKTLDGYNV